MTFAPKTPFWQTRPPEIWQSPFWGLLGSPLGEKRSKKCQKSMGTGFLRSASKLNILRRFDFFWSRTPHPSTPTPKMALWECVATFSDPKKIPPWRVRGPKNGLGDLHGMHTNYLYLPQPISRRNGHCSGPPNGICTENPILADPTP
jgi:hypothetical protein